MAAPSSRLDDSDMLEHLDTTDSDGDFIPESDTDDTRRGGGGATLPALCLTVKRMTWMVSCFYDFFHKLS
jgi:hypothetical protein